LLRSREDWRRCSRSSSVNRGRVFNVRDIVLRILDFSRSVGLVLDINMSLTVMGGGGVSSSDGEPSSGGGLEDERTVKAREGDRRVAGSCWKAEIDRMNTSSRTVAGIASPRIVVEAEKLMMSKSSIE